MASIRRRMASSFVEVELIHMPPSVDHCCPCCASVVQRSPSAPDEGSACETAALCADLFGIDWPALHELTHIVSGRAVGIAAVLAGPTSVALPAGAPIPSGSRVIVLALIAPLLTMAEGAVAFVVLVRSASRLPQLLARFVGWATVVGLPYNGVESC